MADKVRSSKRNRSRKQRKIRRFMFNYHELEVRWVRNKAMELAGHSNLNKLHPREREKIAREIATTIGQNYPEITDSSYRLLLGVARAFNLAGKEWHR